jgi:hypothetical protein
MLRQPLRPCPDPTGVGNWRRTEVLRAEEEGEERWTSWTRSVEKNEEATTA